MKVALEQHEQNCLIRLEGQVTLASAVELKALLLEWLASGKSLELDLAGAEEIDITTLQLLNVAVRDAGRSGVGILVRASHAVEAAVRNAGFDQIPGFPV